MRMRSILGTLVIASMPVMPVWAVEMTQEEIQKLVDEAVNRKLQEHERRESTGERAMEQRTAQPGAQYPTETHPINDIKVELKGEESLQ